MMEQDIQTSGMCFYYYEFTKMMAKIWTSHPQGHSFFRFVNTDWTNLRCNNSLIHSFNLLWDFVDYKIGWGAIFSFLEYLKMGFL